jgi:hypothetical protein
MRIEIKVSKAELEDSNMDADSLQAYILDKLEDLPAFNAYIKITDEVEI